MYATLTDADWAQFERDGFVKLRGRLDAAELAALQARIDAIMLGQAPVPYARLLMQLDSETGRYEDAGLQSKGFKGATLAYRKIQDLEWDPIFLEFLRRPVFQDICARAYGPATPIAVFRAMFMNKPARRGTWLPWHQDRWTYLDRDPLVTLWTALDPATSANGCVQLVPGSHRRGLLNPSHPSGFLTPAQAAAEAPPARVVLLELAAGECALLHNYTLHASDVNCTDTPRRAFSVCYMDARTCVSNGEMFTRVFGEGALTPAACAGSPVAGGKEHQEGQG